MTLPTYVTPEKALERAPEHFVNSHQVLFWMRDEMIRDTPFCYSDVYDLMVELSELDPQRFDFSPDTLRKVLSWFKRVGHIRALDTEHSDPSRHVYMWSSYYDRRLRWVRSQRSEPAPSTAQDALEDALEDLLSES
jgi:hypothetical protein